MKIKLNYIIGQLAIISFLALTGCSEEEGNAPYGSDTTPPGIVENVVVENMAGKVKLTYDLPDSNNLLYVVARYQTENGTNREVTASYFTNTMLLEGFSGDSSINVTLNAVSRTEVESLPVNVTVNPELAPIYAIFDSLNVGPDFGGIRVQADNPEREDIAILVMQKNDADDWEPLSTSIYTAADEINRAIRGYEPEPEDFAIAIRDRWLNVTDTLYTTITPIYEQLMPKNNYSPASMANDAGSINEAYPVSNLWDNEYFWWWGSYFTERTLDIGPHLVTMNIGEETKISRLHIWAFSEPIGGQQLYYYLGAMKKFRIWGATEAAFQASAAAGGDLVPYWTLLGDFEVDKPSGLPYGQEDNDDLIAAQDGVDYEIDVSMPSVKYLRIECLENWIGGEFMAISEIHVYGNPNF